MNKHDNVIGYPIYYRQLCTAMCRAFYYRKEDETDWQITKIFYGRHIRRLLM